MIFNDAKLRGCHGSQQVNIASFVMMILLTAECNTTRLLVINNRLIVLYPLLSSYLLSGTIQVDSNDIYTATIDLTSVYENVSVVVSLEINSLRYSNKQYIGIREFTITRALCSFPTSCMHYRIINFIIMISELTIHMVLFKIVI